MPITFNVTDEGITALAKLYIMQAAQSSVFVYPKGPHGVRISRRSGTLVFTVESKDGACSMTIDPQKTVERFIREQMAELTKELQHTSLDYEKTLKVRETFSELVHERINNMFFLAGVLAQETTYSLHLLSDGMARQSESLWPLFPEARKKRLLTALEKIATRLKLRLGLIPVENPLPHVAGGELFEVQRLLEADEMPPPMSESTRRGSRKVDDYAALKAIVKLGGHPSVNRLAEELAVERATVRLWVQEHGCKDLEDLLERLGDLSRLPVLSEDEDEPPRPLL